MRLNPNAGKTWPKKLAKNNHDFSSVQKSRKFPALFFSGSSQNNNLNGGDPDHPEKTLQNVTDYLYQNLGNQIIKIPLKVLPCSPILYEEV